MGLEYLAHYDDAAGVLAVAGVVDHATVDEFRDGVLAATDGFRRNLVVDVAAVTFMPSEALAVLVQARKRCSDAGVVFTVTTSPNSITARILDILGFPHEVFPPSGDH